MNDRPDDELNPSHWLAQQFEKPAPDAQPAAEVPTEVPTVPPAVAPPAAPGPFVNPFAGQSNPYQQPLVSPAPPAAQPPVAQTPMSQPPATQPPATQPPAVPPVTEPPAAATPPPATGFSWGLTAGAPAPQAAPPAPQPAVRPSATPAMPPIAPPPATMPPTMPPMMPPTAAPVEAAAPSAPFAGPVLPAPAPAASAPPAASMPPALVEPPEAERAQPATPSWDQPTQAFAFVPPPTEAMPAPITHPMPDAGGPTAAELLGATEVLAGAPADGAVSEDAPAGDSALDSLFGDQNFRDYDADPAPPVAPVAREVRVDPGHISKRQKILLWVAGGLVGVLALVALFLLGTRLPALTAAEPTPTPTATAEPTPTPTPTVLPVGPVEPGEWAWDELLGGECLDPYSDPWAEEFTVVDCAEPHPAQMVVRGTFAPSAEGVTDDVYPGAEALQGQLSLLCSAPGVIDLAVAGQYPDVQFQGSYPASAELWDAGDRTYYCFVSRASGEPLTGSVAVPPAPPAA